jgi:hypothetical protein
MATPSIPYTTMAQVLSLVGLEVSEVSPVIINNSPIGMLTEAALLTRLPNHETLAGTDSGEMLLNGWATLYGALQLLTLSPHIFVQTSTFEGETFTKRSINIAAIQRTLTEQFLAIESRLKSKGEAQGTTSYGFVGIASPSYDVIAGV